ncbi:MAG: V-type ATP synthase subunit D [Oscillospiraceae bacterium]|nr:V-type ATP synthase subunit D [Oscillospiraceae bacterium]
MYKQVYPTKGNLLNTKKSLELARTGYDLMDRKRNILIKKMMSLIKNAEELQDLIYKTYEEAYKMLGNAVVTLGNIDDIARLIPVENSVNVSFLSVMGVEIPEITLETKEIKNYFGYDQTNSLLDEAYIKFEEVKRYTVMFCEIENAVFYLAHGIKKTQKRANALKSVIIPRFEYIVHYITNALEEKDREEFFRMKVLKKKKLID